MITLDNVTFTRPDGNRRVTALQDVSMHVDNGHVAVITGPSGSGKSSLLAVASTLARPDTGTILIDGIDVTGLDDAGATELRREKIGIVFQQSNLIPSLDAVDQLVMMGELDGAHRSTRDERREQAKELLDAVEPHAQEAGADVRWTAPASQHRPGPHERPQRTGRRRADQCPGFPGWHPHHRTRGQTDP